MSPLRRRLHQEPSAVVIQLLIKIPHRTSEVISLPLQLYLFISLAFPAPPPPHPPSAFIHFKSPIPHRFPSSVGALCCRVQDRERGKARNGIPQPLHGALSARRDARRCCLAADEELRRARSRLWMLDWIINDRRKFSQGKMHNVVFVNKSQKQQVRHTGLSGGKLTG